MPNNHFSFNYNNLDILQQICKNKQKTFKRDLSNDLGEIL